jgi:hypothetical protein
MSRWCLASVGFGNIAFVAALMASSQTGGTVSVSGRNLDAQVPLFPVDTTDLIAPMDVPVLVTPETFVSKARRLLSSISNDPSRPIFSAATIIPGGSTDLLPLDNDEEVRRIEVKVLNQPPVFRPTGAKLNLP